MKDTLPAMLAMGLALAGCTTSHLPKGARLVGGGLDIRYSSPTAGTVILIERTSGRIVATKSLEGNGHEFHFSPNSFDNGDVLAAMFSTALEKQGEVAHVPTNTFFQLYFVPEKTRRE
jgi:hypothetical protein